MLILGLIDLPWWAIFIIVFVGYLLEFMGAKPVLVVYDEEMLSEIMVKKFSSFTNRIAFKTGDPMNDEQLLNIEDAHWKHVRSEMTPAFSSGKLKKMMLEINRSAKSLAEALSEKIGEEVDISEYTGAFTMDVIAATAFGIRVNSQKDRNNEFVDHAKRAFDTPPSLKVILVVFFPKLCNFLRKLGFNIQIGDQNIRDFFSNITKQAMEMRKTDEDKTRTDFLQLMVKAQRGENIQDEGDDTQSGEEKPKKAGLSTDEILANAMLFFIAGYDTTSKSLSYFLYNMAVYPDIQEKLVQEINDTVEDKENVDATDLQKMHYLDQCVQENLRIYPPAIRVNRAAKEDVRVKNVIIKKGVGIVFPIYGIHRDPNKWPEPERFDPERFSPERKHHNVYHYIPFGNGPRACIGMRLAVQELKIAIVHLLRRVKPTVGENTKIPLVIRRSSALLKVKGGVHLKMERRI